jgi:ADP-ribose pyrophosphatase YjhB (NUDIX family)
MEMGSSVPACYNEENDHAHGLESVLSRQLREKLALEESLAIKEKDLRDKHISALCSYFAAMGDDELDSLDNTYQSDLRDMEKTHLELRTALAKRHEEELAHLH